MCGCLLSILSFSTFQHAFAAGAPSAAPLIITEGQTVISNSISLTSFKHTTEITGGGTNINSGLNYAGARVNGGSLSYTGPDISVNISNLSNLKPQASSTKPSAPSLRVFQVNQNGVLNLGSEETESVSINISDKGGKAAENAQVFGLVAMGMAKEGQVPATLNVNAKNLYININLEEANYAGAIHVQGSSPEQWNSNSPRVVLNAAAHISVSGNSTALSALSSGIIETHGDLYIATANGAKAITSRGGALVNVNSEGKSIVQINGQVTFDYDETTSGTPLDGNVLLNLTGSNSFWNGNAQINFSDISSDKLKDIQKEKLSSSNLTLTLKDGATWNPTAAEFEENKDSNNKLSGSYYAPVRQLTMDNGIINVSNNGQPVIVESLQGKGQINVQAAKNGDAVTAGKFVVGTPEDYFATDTLVGISSENAASGANLNVQFLGITSDDITSEQFNELASNVDASGAVQTQTVNEGLINGKMIQTVAADGTVSPVVTEVNTVNQSLRDIGAITFLGLRSTMNDLDKRLGDLRSYSGNNGGWVRYLGGQNRYGSGNMKLNYNGFQAGFDHRFGEFYAGAAFGYTKGKGHLRNGSSDNDNWNFGLYGGWLGEKGQFVDLIIKRHRFKNEFNLHNSGGLASGGDYHNWATSFSIEGGWRLQCPTTGFYAEPQVEFSFGRMESGSFTTSQGVKVKQDSTNTTVGRIGVAAGYTLPDNKGNAYVKASVLHDWSAKVKGSMSKGGLKQSYRDDLSGSWGEFSIGGTYNPTKHISAYAEVQTSTGSPIRSPWSASVGLRYNF